jgi:small conductance mechanosensitive channel
MDFESFDPGEAMETLVELVSQWGLKVLGAVVVLVVGRWLAGRVRKAMTAGLTRSKLDPTLIPFVTSLVYYGIFAFVIIAVLGLFGIPTASFIAVLGAAGLAVGLALQGTLSNFAAGVMLLTFRPFRVGDYVDAGGTAGTVAAIGVFTTTLNTPDNVQITVPNSGVFGETIKNFSANPTRRNDMVVGVSYDDDLGVALDTIKRVVTADARVLAEPTSTIAVSELGDSSVNIVVRPWCKKEDYWALRFDLTRALKEELEKAGCSIPFPQRDVHLYRTSEDEAA